MVSPEQDPDSDWEYEYSTTETEAFYIPIDLSNLPDEEPHKTFADKSRPGHPRLLKSRIRMMNAAARASGPAFPGNGSSNTGEAPTGTEPDSASAGAEAGSTPLQITGLHTRNPLVLYNNQILSCHWSETLGTDLFFAAPEVGDVQEPLRELPGEVDLLAMGSAKLIARKATVVPVEGIEDEVVLPGDRDGDGDVVMGDERAQGQDGTGTTAQTATAPPQSGFLARFNAAKARRGDSTQLAVSSGQGGKKIVAQQREA